MYPPSTTRPVATVALPCRTTRPRHLRATLLAGAGALALSACQGPVDSDLRGYGNGFSTAEAVQNLPNRPRPDDRGVISYPNYQVALARDGDTMRSVAQRLGLEAETLARYNGVQPDDPLRRDEVVALPGRVAEPSPATGAVGTGPILPASRIDVTTLASSAIDRAGTQPQGTPLPPAASPPPPAAASAEPPRPAPQTGTEPIRHQVLRGETAYSVARLYNVPLRSIAEWNALGPELGIREGQFLLIPVAGAAAPPRPAATTPPGAGSTAPVPPSAAAPLPAPTPAAQPQPAPAPPAPDLGAQPAPAASNKPLAFPVRGSIIRAYAAGRNEGIDIGAPAGTEVKAAAAGTVAAVTRNTDGINIVVIRHEGSLLTVYTHIDSLTVAKDATVRQGQTIGKVRPGDPSFLHFEVRRGMQSVDPTDFLP